MGLQIDSDVLMKALIGLATAQNTNAPRSQFSAKATYGTDLTYAAPGSAGNVASLAGCCGLFDPCGSNALLSLTQSGDQFLDWLGWRPNNECNQFVKLLSYMGAAGTAAGTIATGAVAPCAAAPGVEFGTCELLLPDKGRIARAGPVRDLTDNNRKLCDTYPVFTLEGQQITDEITWSLMLAGTALVQDLKRMVIGGNSGSTGEFAGLEQLVNTGYVDARFNTRCSAMDSTVLNWGNNLMSTKVNGFDLVTYLIDIVRKIRTRAKWSSLGSIGQGEQILLMPAYLRDQLLDTFTFWSIQPGVAYAEINFMNYETRTFRNALNGGTFGDGQIFIDGQTLPIITYDWDAMTQAAPNFIGDIYVLTRRIGNTPVMWGQYIDMAQPAQAFSAAAGYSEYRATDGGKFLSYWKTDETCTKPTILMRPNIYLSAPWAQARISGVAAHRPLQPMQPDPKSGYFVEGYKGVAVCPEDYLVASI